MGKYVINIDLDGYNTEQEHDTACKEYIKDQLNASGCCLTIQKDCSDNMKIYIRGAIAALTQHTTFPVDIEVAKGFLEAALIVKP